MALGLGGQEVLDHLVQHEATFAGHELHRHLTVLVRTEKQLLICHVDEGEGGRTEALSTVEVVALRAIDSVVVTRARCRPGAPLRAERGVADDRLGRRAPPRSRPRRPARTPPARPTTATRA